MMTVCRHLEMLLTDVYLATYGGTGEDVQFSVCAMPRIEINTVDEICQMLDSGMVSVENAMDLSNMIFGLDLKQSVGKAVSDGRLSSAFVTPKNRGIVSSASTAVVSKASPAADASAPFK